MACLFVAVTALAWVPVLAAQDEPLFFVYALPGRLRAAVTPRAGEMERFFSVLERFLHVGNLQGLFLSVVERCWGTRLPRKTRSLAAP